MSIDAIIFDIYGTLLEVGPPPADSDTQWESLCRDMLNAKPRLSRLNFSIAANKVITRLHEDARNHGIVWPEVHWPSVVKEVMPELAQLPVSAQEEFIFRHIQTGHTTRMTSETASALRRFKDQRLMLGIASNAQAYTLRELQDALAFHGLDMNLFQQDLCFWSFKHGFSKPDPHVFQILSSRLVARGIRPATVLMVGDRLDNDIVPAKSHGWQTWQLAAGSGQLGSDTGDWPQLVRRAEPKS